MRYRERTKQVANIQHQEATVNNETERDNETERVRSWKRALNFKNDAGGVGLLGTLVNVTVSLFSVFF